MSRPVGLISALPAEFSYFEDFVDSSPVVREAGWEFRNGVLEDIPLVIVEAGLGKVQTAVVATLLIQQFGCGGLIFSGVAGGLSPDLAIGDAVVATRVIQHDYGALAADGFVRYQPGVPPLPGIPTDHGYALDTDVVDTLKSTLHGFRLPRLPGHLPIEDRQPTVNFGTILTGDQFVNSEEVRNRLFGETGALAVEMEGGAMAQVAERLGVPWLVLRTLSDLAGVDSHIDFNVFTSAVASGAAALVREVLPVIVAKEDEGEPAKQ